MTSPLEEVDTDTEVYLTGGTGFIGSHLRSALANQGIPVTLLVRDETSIETSENERVHVGDVTVPDSLSLKEHGMLIHLAGQTSVERAITHPRETWDINANGTLNVLEAARKAGVSRILYTSTASIYGPPKYLPIDEDHPTQPAEPYGASKSAADSLVRSYVSSYDMDAVIVRIFNAFGPGQPSYNVVPEIISQALTKDIVELGNLSPSRDFIYIDDVISGLITTLIRGEKGTAYNIGRGDSISVGDLAEMVVNAVDFDIEIVSTADRQRSDEVEIPRHVADISRLRELGWEPTHEVQEGIEETIVKTLENK